MSGGWYVIYLNDDLGERELFGPFETSSLGDLWVAMMQRRGWAGEYLLLQPSDPDLLELGPAPGVAIYCEDCNRQFRVARALPRGGTACPRCGGPTEVCRVKPPKRGVPVPGSRTFPGSSGALE